MFSIPRHNDIQLESEKVKCKDLYNIHFCDNYEWIINLLCSAVAVYLLTQIYFVCWPEVESEELNLSVIWLLVLLCNTLYIFYLLNAALFRSSNGSGEQSLMILCGASSFVGAMAVMLLDDEILELGINKAYDNITAKVLIFKNKTQLITKEWQGSLIVWRLFLGVMCAIMASFLVFPSFRLARLHIAALYQTNSRVMKLLHNVSFIAPLFISILWVKPLTRDLMVGHQKNSHTNQKLTDGSFDAFRLGALLAFCLLRLALLRSHLQSHLLMAQDRLKQIKREPGRIVAVELQSQIQNVFLYLLAIALQYILPIIVLFSWTLLAHCLGGYSLVQGFHHPQQLTPTLKSRYNWGINADDEAVREFGFIASQFAEVIDTPTFWENHVLFGCWWMVTVGFVLSVCGIMYCRYIDW